MLSDQMIRKLVESEEITISPFQEENLNPASMDLTLHPVLRLPMRGSRIDMKRVIPGYTREFDMGEDYYEVAPGEFLLACTEEVVGVPPTVMARVEGKSSIGRVGLAVHITAGYIDPGFVGQITLEIANLSHNTIVLWPHMRIAQVAFQYMDGEVERPYSVTGHYQNQTGPTESRYTLEKESA